MIFRWSFWGRHKANNIELLRYSIASFQKQFGNTHSYIVYTDNIDFISNNLGISTDIRQFPSDEDGQFCFSAKPTWRKWCPSARLDIGQDEFFIDSDVFLVKYPKEIDFILSNQKTKFAILDEFNGQPYQHGAMSQRATRNTPFINAGFFLQKVGSDISSDLLRECEWWKRNIAEDNHTHHDEQGALAVALTEYLMRDELAILPKDKYMLISETSNPNIKNLDSITLFHATYPTHPAFYKFKNILSDIIGF
jgi:hypothetical protein